MKSETVLKFNALAQTVANRLCKEGDTVILKANNEYDLYELSLRESGMIRARNLYLYDEDFGDNEDSTQWFYNNMSELVAWLDPNNFEEDPLKIVG